MKCKVCGAYNEDYLEYCENCAAPLTPDEPEPIPAEDSYVASTGETPPAWGFVRAPQWPKPEFDANTVSEEDIPANYSSRFNPRPAQQQAQAQQPSAPASTDAGYRSNVRVHMPAQEPVAPAARQGTYSRRSACAPLYACAQRIRRRYAFCKAHAFCKVNSTPACSRRAGNRQL